MQEGGNEPFLSTEQCFGESVSLSVGSFTKSAQTLLINIVNEKKRNNNPFYHLQSE